MRLPYLHRDGQTYVVFPVATPEEAFVSLGVAMSLVIWLPLLSIALLTHLPFAILSPTTQTSTHVESTPHVPPADAW